MKLRDRDKVPHTIVDSNTGDFTSTIMRYQTQYKHKFRGKFGLVVVDSCHGQSMILLIWILVLWH